MNTAQWLVSSRLFLFLTVYKLSFSLTIVNCVTFFFAAPSARYVEGDEIVSIQDSRATPFIRQPSHPTQNRYVAFMADILLFMFEFTV